MAKYVSKHLTQSSASTEAKPVYSKNLNEEKPARKSLRPAAEEKTRKVRNSSGGAWLKRLALFAGALLVIGIIACVVLYRFSAVFEYTRPEPVMDSLISSMTEEDWISAAESAANFPVSEFEDPAVLFRSYIEVSQLSGNVSYRKEVSSSGKDVSVFVVRDGITNICTVSLLPEQKNEGFGRHVWKPGSIKAYDITSSLSSVSISVEAGEGESVFLNGIEISSAYLTGSGIPRSGVTALEKRYSVPLKCSVYSVSPLYGNISVTDAAGKELRHYLSEDGKTVVYSTAGLEKHSLRISAPEDVSVYVGGALLTAEDVSSSDLGIFKGVTDFTAGKEYKTAEYSFDGLLELPEVTAVDADGIQLQPIVTGEGDYFFYHKNDDAFKAQAEDAVSAFFKAYTDYCSQKYDATLYNRVINKVLRHSPIYEYFASSYDVMFWATKTETEYNELKFDNFCRVSDRCFICTISYKADLTSTSWVDRYSYDVQDAYEVVFVHENGLWLAADMTAVSH